MKFEASVPAVENGGASRSSAPTARFTLEHGAWIGQAFTVSFGICLNPCCGCGNLGFECRPDATSDAAEPGGPAAPARVSFDLDVFEREINAQVKSSPEGVALARAVVAEMQAPEWEWLTRLFLAYKRRQMKTMDLDALHVVFPPEVIAGDGPMVAYAEIFPWAEPFEFTLGGTRWVVDDQYCVRPGCGCTEPAAAFFHLPERPGLRAGPKRTTIALRYNYLSGDAEVLEAKCGSPAATSAKS